MKITRCVLPKISKSLLPAKAAYFFFYFSYSSVTPFIPVFITAYGLNAEQAGFILGARLFSQFLSGPCWGALADKTHRYRLMLLLQVVVSTILTFAAPWIPLVLPQSSGIGSVSVTEPTTQSMYTTAPYTNAILSSTGSRYYSFLNKTTFAINQENNKEASTTPYLLSTSNNTVASRALQLQNSTQPTTLSVTPLPVNGTTVANTKPVKDKGVHKGPDTGSLFVIMMVWFALIGFFDGGIPILIDNSVMNTIKKLQKSDFGKQRLWGAVGFGLAAFASGVGIELSGKKEPNYTTMFYIFLGSNICLFVSCFFLKMKSYDSESILTVEAKPRNLLKSLLKEMKKFHVIFFFLTILIMGIANGLLYGFMFLYIQDLHGSKIIMGLSILVACSTEVMMFPVSSKVIDYLRGNVPAMFVAFTMYVVRFMGFSYLQNAWFILVLQLLHSVCFALFWAAAVYETSALAPEGMQATFLGIMNGIFFGIAGGSSSVFGGIVYNHFGGRHLFRGFAIVCAVWAFFLLLHLLERNRRSKRKAKETEHEMQENENIPVTAAAERLLASTETSCK